MRSSTVLAALVAGAIDVVSAGRCNLPSTLSGTTSNQATDGSTGTATSKALSETISTGLAGSTTIGTTKIGTTTISGAPTTTSKVTIVTNAIRGGSFEGYSPEFRNGIYGFQSEGAARLISGHGYKGTGSKDDNCVEMEARSPNAKRDAADVGQFAAIEQQLEDLDVTSLYTVNFYYYVLENDLANTCRFDVYYGNDLFSSTPYFPPAAATDLNGEWMEVVDQAAVKTSSGLLSFQLNCVDGGHATIWVDQVFFSDQVSPDNVDSISLMFTWDASAPTAQPPPDSTTTTTTVIPVTTESTSTQSTSDSSTTSTQVTTTSTTASSTTSTAMATTSSTSATTTTSSGPTPSGNKYCASLSATGAAGRGCAIRPYNPSSGYKTISNTRMTMQQCAAVCLADSRCQQFQWSAYSSSYPCLNTCILLETNLGTAQGIQGPYYAYDRSCIQRTECAQKSSGSICVNALGDTPAAGCATQMGTVKSCASAFLTTNVGMVCDSSKECRDLCAQHNACKSYSINFAGGCSLYSGTVSQIVQPGSSGQMFYDLSCNACDSTTSMGYFNYVAQMDDSDTTMVNNCPLVTATSTTQTTTSTTQQSTTSTTSTTTSSPTTSSTSTTSTTSAAQPTSTCALLNGQGCSLKSFAASGTICKQVGNVQYDASGYSLKDYPFQGSPEQCAAICAQNSGCKASAYDSSQGSCSFLSVSVTQAQFMATPGGSDTWSDQACWDCPTCSGTASTSTTSSASSTSNTSTSNTSTSTTSSTSVTSSTSTTSATSSSTTTSTSLTTTTVSSTSTTSTSTSTTSAAQSTPTCALTNGQGCTLKTLAAAGTTCKQVGTIEYDAWGYDTADFPFQGSPEQCAAICAQNIGCQASSYDSSRHTCDFIGTSLATAEFKASAGAPGTWSDQSCWDCPSCSVPTSTTSTAPTTSATSTTSAALPTGTCALTNGQGCSLKTLAGSGTYCKQTGNIMEEAWAVDSKDYPFQGSAEQCAAVCAQINGCKSSAFDSSRSSCAFIGDTLAQAQFSAAAGSLSWSDQACWNCPTCSISASTTSSSASSSPTTFETSTRTTATSTSLTQTSTTSQSPTSTACVVTATLNDDVTCGLPGASGNQAQSMTLSNYVIKPVANLGACAQVCLARTDCQGFSYASDTKVCIPYTAGTSSLGLSYISTSKTRYYDGGCYACA